MEKTIALSALLISFSITLIGSIMIINNQETVSFFYNLANTLFIVSILGIIIILFTLLKHIYVRD